MLMGTNVSPYEQPMGAKGNGICSSRIVDYSPLAQPCSNDFAKSGMYSRPNAMSELEHLRPGMYSGMKGGYDSFWKVPNWGNP
ncbi:hypothetical protein GUITHDRAFT_110851 [Guillardia theta CCMP2712]|uniref:Uncharacterized protein n=1 Tax=Guillardia theta (strain CCMP2712) TaxID=905079 RepID=L1J455_GUITC|nr:hypothetical protein GUITHDRAFT_110851 [Guillardia theta CCMP2712]EKX43122.1 hypothetical protein GUITHDRAFT_110851 [Guillardia theta CCMP2712]|eukprot:XP_005830102.1 hypothetical protein GUITHDRAFT_110851 [Guillardia theta CCMP2712]